MKKIFAAFSVMTTALMFAPFAFAQTASPSAKMLVKGGPAAKDNRMTTIVEKADAEITRRVTSLNSLVTKLTGAKKIPAQDVTLFTSQIQDYITELTTLKGKIDGDSDLNTLKVDARSIFTNFRVYAVFMPKLAELSAIDRMETAADSLTDVATKLQATITQMQSQGKDVTELQSWLTDMNSKIADAKTLYQAVETEITPLAPDGYPGNVAVLKDGRAKINTGAQDLKTALADALQIRQSIKSGVLSTTPSSATNSATSSATP